MKYTIVIEKFHPLTVVYPDIETIPAGADLFIQLPPVTIDFGAVAPGLIDQHIISEASLYGYTMHFEEEAPLSQVASFIVSGDMPKLLEETWRLVNEHHKEPLAKEAPRSMSMIALARSMGREI